MSSLFSQNSVLAKKRSRTAVPGSEACIVASCHRLCSTASQYENCNHTSLACYVITPQSYTVQSLHSTALLYLYCDIAYTLNMLSAIVQWLSNVNFLWTFFLYDNELTDFYWVNCTVPAKQNATPKEKLPFMDCVPKALSNTFFHTALVQILTEFRPLFRVWTNITHVKKILMIMFT